MLRGRTNAYSALWVAAFLLLAPLHPAIGQSQIGNAAEDYFKRAIEIGLAPEPIDSWLTDERGIQSRLIIRRIPDGGRPTQAVITKSVYDDNWHVTIYEFKRTTAKTYSWASRASGAAKRKSLNQESLVDIRQVELPTKQWTELADRFASLRVSFLLETKVWENKELVARYGLVNADNYITINGTIYEIWYESIDDSAYRRLAGIGIRLDGELHPLAQWIDDAFTTIVQSQTPTEGNQE